MVDRHGRKTVGVTEYQTRVGIYDGFRNRHGERVDSMMGISF